MQRSRRRRRSPPPRAGGAGIIVAISAVLLVGTMGIVALDRPDAVAQPVVRHAAPTPAARTAQAHPTPAPAPAATAAPSLTSLVTQAVRDAERNAKHLRAMDQGADRERTRTTAMAALSDAREQLGAHLDEHPGDLRANRLWDRLQRVYITLKKL